MKNYIKILLCASMGMVGVLMAVTIVLLIKVNYLEKRLDITISTNAESNLSNKNETSLLNKNESSLTAEFYTQYVPVSKEVNPNWEKWKDVRYNYGFDTNEQPVFNTINGVLESDTMISVRGGKGRWNNRFVSGGHVFEGWSGNELSRLTLLMGKFHETFACIQTYSPAGLYEENPYLGKQK